ncbi:MAG: GTP 3',8-cyclase MoaA [Planctomycetes bacterium]|jgi:cyclic pyranopterin phosphate synthase|nr:GTP 3',8-cyclase MoaA [Planctomycetota bacterium]MCL4729617.1 GTP 3',8-cyclase MoaA [Planctomycetota bacterium]
MAIPTPTDTRGRHLRDLRISVTDRCNLRCGYCMPAEVFGPDYKFLPKADILSYEEITRLARAFAALGVTKLRITGGEPLLRRDLPQLIAQLRAVQGIEDIALTTNGLLLPAMARDLKAAGLNRVTISLDSLDDATFGRMNGKGVGVAPILKAVEAAQQTGFAPVKLNMVVQRGVNDHEIEAMALRWRGTGVVVRFIEFMDVGTTNGWRMDDVLPAREIMARINARWPLQSADPNYPGEVASRWRYADGAGEIGVISSVTNTFCGDCTRARLSARGELFTCLFAAKGHDLRALVRNGGSDESLAKAIAAIWRARDDRYSELRAANASPVPKAEMSYLGG